MRVVETEDEHAEARFVAAEVAGLVEYGTSLGEIAVVYRTNAQSRVLEDVLVRQGVDYQVIGGPRFYERAEIRDAIAYLQAIDNPFDSVSLARIANRPRRGVGDTSLARLQTLADGAGRSRSGRRSAVPRRPGSRRRRCSAVQALAHAPPVADGGGAGALDPGAARARDRAHRVPRASPGDAPEVGGGGKDREPRGARRCRPRVRGGGRASRRSRPSCRRSPSTPTRTRCATTRAAAR